MLSYPQLSTGSIAQFPIRRTRSDRTVVTETLQGCRKRFADPMASFVRWDLEYRGLSDLEVQALESFFIESRGQLRSFAFVDPTANVLAQSEDLRATAWDCAPLLSVEDCTEAPKPGLTAFTLSNDGPTAAVFAQTVTCPSSYTYSFSVYIQAPGGVELAICGDDRSSTVRLGATNVWQRPYVTASGSAGDETTMFAVQVSAGTSVNIAAPQVDAQPMPSEYRRSTRSGVYLSTRFDQDDLHIRTEGPNCHSTSVRLISRANW